MKKHVPYRSMNIGELIRLIDKRDIKRPPGIGGIRAVAQQTPQDIEEKNAMIAILEDYDKNKWSRTKKVGPILKEQLRL